MTGLRRHSLALGLVVAALTPGALRAQGTLTGVVRDTAGRPISDAAVALDPGEGMRYTRADGQGRFRFTRVPAGSHILRGAMIGYRPKDRPLVMTAKALHVEIVLERVPLLLDTLAIVARRTGIVGTTIAQEGFRALGGVQVEVMGTRYSTRTKANGKFEFPEVKEGGYVIAARKDGYRTRLISTAVPAAAAVEVALILDTLLTETDRRFEVLLRQMKSRINWRRQNTSAIVSRQELAATPGVPLHDALRYAPSVYGKGLILLSGNVCTVFVDGTRAAPAQRLSDFSADDVAMVEVYETNGCAETVPGKQGVTVIRSNARPGHVVHVWLKR